MNEDEYPPMGHSQIIGQKSALFTLCEVSNLIAMGTCEACQYEVVRV